MKLTDVKNIKELNLYTTKKFTFICLKWYVIFFKRNINLFASQYNRSEAEAQCNKINKVLFTTDFPAIFMTEYKKQRKFHKK